MASDRIAFLPVNRTITFDGGALEPVPEFAASVAEIQTRLHSDGYVYAPQTPAKKWHAGSADAVSTPGAVQWNRNSLAPRNALLFHLPPSHTISISATPTGSDFRRSDGGFLIHLVGYLHGVRLQFFDWRFDYRVRLKSTHNVYVHPTEEEDFVGHSFAEWRTWDKPNRELMTNSLYLLVRSSTYDWDWERFNSNYIVFDSLYRLAVRRHLISEMGHRQRLHAMCQTFGLHEDDSLIDQIYKLRNPLVHEGIWAGQQPGTLVPEEYHYAFLNLEKINQRLVPALLGFPSEYTASPWTSLGVFPFKRKC